MFVKVIYEGNTYVSKENPNLSTKEAADGFYKIWGEISKFQIELMKY